MELSREERDGHEVIRLATDHVAATLLAATGRILEIRNLDTGREVLRWVPMMLELDGGRASGLGGVGETAATFERVTWQREDLPGRLAFRCSIQSGNLQGPLRR